MPKVAKKDTACSRKEETLPPSGKTAADTGQIKQKAKRTTNPGVRVQGGRIYDSATGTTCHQCRQKTVEVKAKCTECTLWWCPRCLSNRYGEEVEAVAQLAKWPCPRCRGDCNCSNCRKKRGLEATGILATVCKKGGLGSVSELLAKNPNAKRPQLPPAARDTSQGPKQPRAETKRKAPVYQPSDLLHEDQLGSRPAPFPELRPVIIRKCANGAKRMRGVVWPASVPEALSLPVNCNAGDLAEVLEFIRVFGEVAGMQEPDLATFAAELVQPSSQEGRSLFSEDRCSPVAIAHQTFLDLVRKDWGLKGTVGNPGWQDTMRQYLKLDRQQAAASVAALSGRTADFGKGVDGPEAQKQPEAASEANAPEYPAGGYWALPPGARLRMLRELCLDALGTSLLRERMEKALEEAAAGEKEQREEQAAARKEAREAWQQQRDRQIAALIAGGSAALTIEEQRALMQTARSQTECDASLAKGKDAQGPPPPEMRTLPLGEDRDGRLFWNLQSAAALTGKEGVVLVAKAWHSVNTDKWSCLDDPLLLAKSLDLRGQKEGPLRNQLAAAYNIEYGGGEHTVQASVSAVKAAHPNHPSAKGDSLPAPIGTKKVPEGEDLATGPKAKAKKVTAKAGTGEMAVVAESERGAKKRKQAGAVAAKGNKNVRTSQKRPHKENTACCIGAATAAHKPRKGSAVTIAA